MQNCIKFEFESKEVELKWNEIQMDGWLEQ